MADLSLFEAAELAATSKVDVWRAIQEGALPAQKTSDGGYAIDQTDLFRVFERKRPEPPLTSPDPSPAPNQAPVATADEASEPAAANDVSVAFAALQAELRSLLGARGGAAPTGEDKRRDDAKEGSGAEFERPPDRRPRREEIGGRNGRRGGCSASGRTRHVGRNPPDVVAPTGVLRQKIGALNCRELDRRDLELGLDGKVFRVERRRRWFVNRQSVTKLAASLARSSCSCVAFGEQEILDLVGIDAACFGNRIRRSRRCRSRSSRTDHHQGKRRGQSKWLDRIRRTWVNSHQILNAFTGPL